MLALVLSTPSCGELVDHDSTAPGSDRGAVTVELALEEAPALLASFRIAFFHPDFDPVVRDIEVSGLRQLVLVNGLEPGRWSILVTGFDYQGDVMLCGMGAAEVLTGRTTGITVFIFPAASCRLFELDCADGVDNDGNGQTDCVDEACDRRQCDDGDSCTDLEICVDGACAEGVLVCGVDGDGDGIDDVLDNCPDDYNVGQGDADSDGIGDLCDPSCDCVLPNAVARCNVVCSVDRCHPGWDQCNTSDADGCETRLDAAHTWYADADGDGYGDPDDSRAVCEQPVNFVPNDGDCDDEPTPVGCGAACQPGAAEVCDGWDNDCNDFVDDSVDCCVDTLEDDDSAAEATLWRDFLDLPTDNELSLFGADADYYSVPFCAGAPVQAEVAAKVPVSLRLYKLLWVDDEPELTPLNAATARQPRLSWEPTGEGAVVVRVTAGNSGGCQDYTIDIQTGPCTPFCGNDYAEVGEACDGVDLLDQTCTTLGEQPGVLRCSDTCEFDVSGCDMPCPTWYPDVDGDSYGDDTSTGVVACTPPADHVDNNVDCDDDPSDDPAWPYAGAADVHPDAAEIPDDNQIDEDCDGYAPCASLDCDGDTDIVAVVMHDGLTHHHNSLIYWGSELGWGSETLGVPTVHGSDAEAADLDGDGFLDLIFANYYNGTSWEIDSYIYWNDPLDPGAFSATDRTELPTIGCRGVEAGDLNGDGWVDLVFSSIRDDVDIPSNARVYWNDPLNPGDFTLARSIELPVNDSVNVAIVDVDGGGQPDLVFAQGTDGFGRIYWGADEPDPMDVFDPGNFDDLTDAANCNGVEFGYLNNDEYPDLVFGCLGIPSESPVMFNDGTGGFSVASTFSTNDCRDVAIVDFSGDGGHDLVFAAYGSSNARIYWDGGGGTYSPVNYGWFSTNSLRVATGDIDLDGYGDIAITGGLGEPVEVFLGSNTLPYPQNPFILNPGYYTVGGVTFVGFGIPVAVRAPGL